MAEAVVHFFILAGAKGVLSLHSSNAPTGIDRMVWASRASRYEHESISVV